MLILLSRQNYHIHVTCQMFKLIRRKIKLVLKRQKELKYKTSKLVLHVLRPSVSRTQPVQDHVVYVFEKISHA